MDERKLAMLVKRGIAERTRNDFSLFIRQCFLTLHPGQVFLPNWHIDLLAEYLDACRRSEIRRLIINVPPRSLKSVTVSVAWPAFLLGHNPSERIVAASYAASLSTKHSQDCRHILRSEWYRQWFPDTCLSPEQNQKHAFTTTAFGHRIATSVGGSVTGRGGNILIIDDPQNPAHALSASTRRRASHWFDHTFSTRLDDKQKGAMVVVMQRLHPEDLTGHLLEKGGWEHLCVPSLADRKTHYQIRGKCWRREAGEPLHPAREDAAMIAVAKRELGSAAFAAQYQQQPVPDEGHMLRREWFRRYHEKPDAPRLRVVQSWDTAIKAGAQHDASVCITVEEYDAGLFVTDVLVLRAEYPQLKKQVLEMAVDAGADTVLIEDKASGQSLLQDLRREKTAVPLIGLCPTLDKLTRFASVSAMIEAGMVFLPVDAPWLAAFESELLAFPHGGRDDQVDALSQCLAWLRNKKNAIKPRMRKL